MAAVPNAISEPTAVESRPSRSPRQATTVVTTYAPIGTRRRSIRRRKRAPGTAPSRATEYIVRAVTDWAAIPHATNASSTIAANGFVDQDPKELTTAVVTGSMSSPATIDAGSGCASVTATALRITSTPTLSSAIQ